MHSPLDNLYQCFLIKALEKRFITRRSDEQNSLERSPDAPEVLRHDEGQDHGLLEQVLGLF